MIIIISAYRSFPVIRSMMVKVIIIMNIGNIVIGSMVKIVGPYPVTYHRRVIEIVIIIAMEPTIKTAMVN